MKRIIKPKKYPELITGPWTLADLNSGKIGTPKNNLNVFSCFHCGGGSTMGYKLAGFNVLGGIEIDSEMMAVYRANHKPDEKFSFNMPIQDFPFMDKSTLQKELFNLDILDGSPPCSSFSMAGSREDQWNEKKLFREGQTEQVLDDLFFHFIKVAEILKPKVIVAENVKGLTQGNAKGYVKEILKAFKDAGYITQLFLLDSSRMGVPQKRERVFFIANRLNKKIDLSFNEKPIPVKDAWDTLDPNERGKDVSKSTMVEYWKKVLPGDAFSTKHKTGSLFGQIKLNPRLPSPTLTSKEYQLWHFDSPSLLSKNQVCLLQSFPMDYSFLNQDPKYICGMSVPPLMMQRVALEISKQFFK